MKIEQTNSWNKYQSKVTVPEQSPYLSKNLFLIDPGFQEVNRLFVLQFADRTQKKYRKYFALSTTIKRLQYYR